MNWGYKILLVYAVFIFGILFLVFKSSTQNQDLVTTDYYEQELKYQQKIDEIQRTNNLSGEIKYSVDGQKVRISFPDEMKTSKLTAQVLLYCVADKNKDMRRNLETENGEINFDIPTGNTGLYELQINWQMNGTGYYYKHKVMIK